MAILKEIAQKAGVSIRTVTRALKDSSDIKLETRERIMEIATELNYRPHFAARSLKIRRTFVVGVIRFRIDIDPENRRLSAASQYLSEQGFSTLQGICRDAKDLKSMVERFQGICEGIIISPAGLGEAPDFYDFMVKQKYPFVIMDPNPAILNKYPCVGIDRENGIVDAIASLEKSGHRKVAFLTQLLKLVNRIDGFKEGLQKLGQSFSPECIIHCPVNGGGEAPLSVVAEYEEAMEAGYRTVLSHPAIGRDYNALFCYSDALALGCMRALFERGLRVPYDVSVIGFDNSLYTGYLHVPLSTIAQPIEEPAKAAVDMLLRQISNERVETRVFPTHFVLRQSS